MMGAFSYDVVCVYRAHRRQGSCRGVLEDISGEGQGYFVKGFSSKSSPCACIWEDE